MAQRIIIVVLFFLLLEIFPARAQLLQFPIEPPGPFVREALSNSYGRALMAPFAKTVAQNADAACLQSKALDDAKLIERGRGVFQRYGTQSMEIIIKNFDTRRYESRIAEIAGPKAAAELMKLRNDQDVKRYLRLERPIRLAKVLDFVVENFERYALLNRINLKSFSGIATGNDELLRANPTEQSEEAIEKFVSASKSRQLKRFIELSEITAPAVMEAVDREFALKWGPMTFYRGVENNLAELCITKR